MRFANAPYMNEKPRKTDQDLLYRGLFFVDGKAAKLLFTFQSSRNESFE